MRPRAMQKGVGQERPRLRSAAQNAQFADRLGLLQRRRIGIRAIEQFDQPARPDRDREPAGNEGEVAYDPVLNRVRRPIEGRLDGDENDDEAKHHERRIEHRLAAARDPARLDNAHTLVSLSVTNPDAPRTKPGPTRGGIARRN